MYEVLGEIIKLDSLSRTTAVSTYDWHQPVHRKSSANVESWDIWIKSTIKVKFNNSSYGYALTNIAANYGQGGNFYVYKEIKKGVWQRIGEIIYTLYYVSYEAEHEGHTLPASIKNGRLTADY